MPTHREHDGPDARQEVEGKTKCILAEPSAATVLLYAKDVLTAGDAAQVTTFPGLGALKTTQASSVFRFLEGRGIPTAFIEQTDDRTIRCWACDMLPMEYVVRRIAWGSYLRRNPAGRALSDTTVERFLKHAVIMPPTSDYAHVLDENAARAVYLKDGRWMPGVHTDPYVAVSPMGWHLHPAKQPLDLDAPLLRVEPLLSSRDEDYVVQRLLLPAFAALEDAWYNTEVTGDSIVLVDCKFEIGRRHTDGALLIGDVIDNDSWRIWPAGNPTRQLDKQMFRDGAGRKEVADAYRLVADLTSRFRY